MRRPLLRYEYYGTLDDCTLKAFAKQMFCALGIRMQWQLTLRNVTNRKRSVKYKLKQFSK